MGWVELRLETTAEAVDWVRSLLAKINYTDSLNVVASTQSEWAFSIQFYVPYDRDANTKVNQIEAQLSSLHRTGLTAEIETTIVEQKLEPVNVLPDRIGNHFVILPPNVDYQSQTDEIILQIPSSFAFGSGFHPATLLSLRLLERHIKPKLQALDLGCGSGILSVAMAKLGAQVLAIDNDAIAVTATQAAINQNQVSDRITVQQASLGKGSELGHWLGGDLQAVKTIQPEQNFDVIVSNLFARILITLSDDLRNALRASGKLILAGFTSEYEPELTNTLSAIGFELIDRAQFGDWIALAYQLQRSDQ